MLLPVLIIFFGLELFSFSPKNSGYISENELEKFSTFQEVDWTNATFTGPIPYEEQLCYYEKINLEALAVSLATVDLGNLADYLFFFADGSVDANWQGASKGFIGDVAVDGLQASERTSGGVAFAGTIVTNDATLNAWFDIVDQNDPPEVDPAQAFQSLNQAGTISSLETDLNNAFTQINGLAATTGFASVSSSSLDGSNFQNGISETIVINVTSELSSSTQIDIAGDAGDCIVMRWDTDADPSNGYQGQVKFQSGG